MPACLRTSVLACGAKRQSPTAKAKKPRSRHDFRYCFLCRPPPDLVLPFPAFVSICMPVECICHFHERIWLPHVGESPLADCRRDLRVCGVHSRDATYIRPNVANSQTWHRFFRALCKAFQICAPGGNSSRTRPYKQRILRRENGNGGGERDMISLLSAANLHCDA